MNLREGGGRDSEGVWDGHAHTVIFKMGPAQGALLSVTWQPGWEGVWVRMDTYIYG